VVCADTSDNATQLGDLDAVLADHSDDIVMFDVPPPEDGVRGTVAYRDLAQHASSGSGRVHHSRSSR
jgi:ketosteroid isomerase-like protein